MPRPTLQQHDRQARAFLGVTVQPMIEHKGYELIVGSSVDRQFGPVILFGAGGVLVEVFQDRALGLPPLNRTLARRLIERTQIYQGACKACAANAGAARSAWRRCWCVSAHFCALFRRSRKSISIPCWPRPRACSPWTRAWCSCRRADRRGPAPARPSSRIPNHYTLTWQLPDGTTVAIRAIRPEDEGLLIAHYASLSERSIRMRFFSMVKTLNRASLIRLCHLDYAGEMALVAERRGLGRGRSSWVCRAIT